MKFIKTNSIAQIFLLVNLYLLSTISIVKAQAEPEIPAPPLPLKPQPIEPETLPPLEEILPELKPNQPDDLEGTTNKVFVKNFEIVGSTVFTPEELAEVLKTYTMRQISFTEILEAQQAIDRLYLENGYITSGTFLPPQQLQDGTVIIEVLEGKVEEIRIEGLDRLDPNYVRSRLEVGTKAPLNRDKLLNALQMLKLNPLIDTLAAELTAGTKPGSSILELNLQEADPFDLTLSLDNYRAPSVGTNRRRAQLAHRNLLGFGDRFDIAYANTEGSNSLSNLKYTIPLNRYNGTFNFRFGYTDNKITQSPFEQFNIESENTQYEFTYRQPLIQKPTEDLAIGLTFFRNNSAATFDEEPFRSPGAEPNGETNTSVIRFFQEYTTRDAKQVFALRSQFSLGIDAFDATINSDNLPDSQFFAWRGQVQYLRLLSPDLVFLVRSDLQVANDPLVSVEQFSVGGAFSVRGYRQDVLLGDNGLFSSAELRATVLRIPKWEANLELTPFIDFGKVWNVDEENLLENNLVSVGIGMRLQVRDNFAARLDWGIPLVEVENIGESLQENGVYFSLEFKPF